MEKGDVIEKPWGKEELVEINEVYVLKRLTMYSGHRCSLQYHEKKTETVYVISGVLRIVLGDSMERLTEELYRPGDALTIRPGVIHRMEGLEDAVYLEASTPELDDVVRISDDYQRAES